jgi:hypothetical protein
MVCKASFLAPSFEENVTLPKHGDVTIFGNSSNKSNYTEEDVKNGFSSGNARYPSVKNIPIFYIKI